MKKTLMALLMAVLLLACWTAVHAEASYVDVDNGTNVTVSGDFSAQIEVARGGHASEGGLTFYNADGKNADWDNPVAAAITSSWRYSFSTRSRPRPRNSQGRPRM